MLSSAHDVIMCVCCSQHLAAGLGLHGDEVPAEVHTCSVNTNMESHS